MSRKGDRFDRLIRTVQECQAGAFSDLMRSLEKLLNEGGLGSSGDVAEARLAHCEFKGRAEALAEVLEWAQEIEDEPVTRG